MRKGINEKVKEMSKKLKSLSPDQLAYIKNIFDKKGYYKKSGEIWCQCCGRIEHQLPGSLDIDIECGYQCSCGAHLTLVYAPRLNRMYDRAYYSVVQTCQGWQVIRTFNVTRNNEKGILTQYDINEVYQNWISPDGEEVILGKSYSRGVNYFFWKYNSDFSIRHHNAKSSGYYAFEDVFDTRGNYFYPKFCITKKLRRNGWKKRIEKLPYVSMAECMKMLLSSNHAETVVKQGQYDVFLHMVRNEWKELEYMNILNICHRNGYMITDASMYFDYIDTLNNLGKDVRNPKYICPDNLYEAHDKALAAWTKIRRVQELLEEKKSIAEKEEDYKVLRGKYFGILITDGTLEIAPLKSVKDFFEEGSEMHHCVYQNKYYKKKDVLILSARINGKRVETIEVNLKTYSIVQSRGACNKNTPYHDQIVNLMNRNMNLIKAI